MIKEGKIKKLPSGKYRVLSEKGRNLGTYDSRSGAENRLREVEYFKHKDKGKKKRAEELNSLISLGEEEIDNVIYEFYFTPPIGGDGNYTAPDFKIKKYFKTEDELNNFAEEFVKKINDSLYTLHPDIFSRPYRKHNHPDEKVSKSGKYLSLFDINNGGSYTFSNGGGGGQKIFVSKSRESLEVIHKKVFDAIKVFDEFYKETNLFPEWLNWKTTYAPELKQLSNFNFQYLLKIIDNNDNNNFFFLKEDAKEISSFINLYIGDLSLEQIQVSLDYLEENGYIKEQKPSKAWIEAYGLPKNSMEAEYFKHKDKRNEKRAEELNSLISLGKVGDILYRFWLNDSEHPDLQKDLLFSSKNELNSFLEEFLKENTFYRKIKKEEYKDIRFVNFYIQNILSRNNVGFVKEIYLDIKTNNLLENTKKIFYIIKPIDLVLSIHNSKDLETTYSIEIKQIANLDIKYLLNYTKNSNYEELTFLQDDITYFARMVKSLIGNLSLEEIQVALDDLEDKGLIKEQKPSKAWVETYGLPKNSRKSELNSILKKGNVQKIIDNFYKFKDFTSYIGYAVFLDRFKDYNYEKLQVALDDHLETKKDILIEDVLITKNVISKLSAPDSSGTIIDIFKNVIFQLPLEEDILEYIIKKLNLESEHHHIDRWFLISKFQNLSEDFIKKYIHFINLANLKEGYNFSEDLVNFILRTPNLVWPASMLLNIFSRHGHLPEDYKLPEDLLWVTYDEIYPELQRYANSNTFNELSSIFKQAKIKPEAPKNAPFGEFLWATHLKDSKETEPDTQLEKKVYQHLKKHFASNRTGLPKETVKLLKSLLKKGYYKSILHPPPTNKLYRGLKIINEEELRKLVGKDSDLEKDGFVEFDKPKALSLQKDKGYSTSWTFKKQITKDFSQKGKTGWAVTLIANTKDNPFSFLAGPGGLYNVNGLSRWHLEKETVGLEPIKIKRIEWKKLKNIKTASQDKPTYSSVMRQLNKEDPEKAKLFAQYFKDAFDEAVQENLEDHQNIALIKALKSLNIKKSSIRIKELNNLFKQANDTENDNIIYYLEIRTNSITNKLISKSFKTYNELKEFTDKLLNEYNFIARRVDFFENLGPQLNMLLPKPPKYHPEATFDEVLYGIYTTSLTLMGNIKKIYIKDNSKIKDISTKIKKVYYAINLVKDKINFKVGYAPELKALLNHNIDYILEKLTKEKLLTQKFETKINLERLSEQLKAYLEDLSLEEIQVAIDYLEENGLLEHKGPSKFWLEYYGTNAN